MSHELERSSSPIEVDEVAADEDDVSVRLPEKMELPVLMAAT